MNATFSLIIDYHFYNGVKDSGGDWSLSLTNALTLGYNPTENLLFNMNFRYKLIFKETPPCLTVDMGASQFMHSQLNTEEI